MSHRIPTFGNRKIEFPGDAKINLSDAVSGFLTMMVKDRPQSPSVTIFCDESEAVKRVEDNEFREIQIQHQLFCKLQ